jgi:hypothetical protein
MVLLLQQYGLVLVNKCNLEFQHFKTFSFYDGNDGFGGLVVSMLAEFAGSNPAEAVGFLRV